MPSTLPSKGAIKPKRTKNKFKRAGGRKAVLLARTHASWVVLYQATSLAMPSEKGVFGS